MTSAGGPTSGLHLSPPAVSDGAVPTRSHIDAFDDNGLEVIPVDECVRILENVSVARVAVTSGALPVIVPVNITLATLDPERGLEVLIRTVAGAKLLAALRNAVVAVEADAIEPMSHSGWSVLVRGRSRVLQDPDEVARAQQLPVTPWATPLAQSFIAVSTDVVTGRRIAPWIHPAPT